ncbi:MAG TPA: sarcosine oxidase subunit alpha family protein [Gammaproteobacteria bacterium]|nr:sarcosine oxidase subunit alpha family protein [Gammaproteobacteria bacterium]
MSQPYRIAEGGRVDREREIRFSFNGQSYTGLAGDTLCSALLANGVHLIGRSWKYHRPRGIMSAGAEEPNAIFQLEKGNRTIPNARGTQVELYDDLDAASVNCWPSLDFDLLSINSWFSRLMPAGFYYKTFMWPKFMWMMYEHFIRKASGLGETPRENDPDRYEHGHAHCDLLVAGGGVAGLAAALAAGRAGARVILVDEQAEFGGLALSSRAQIDGVDSSQWIADAVAELQAMPEVILLPRSTVFGYHDYNFLTVNQRLSDHLPIAARPVSREKLWQVRARQVVLATGAAERPLVFANNDRPGIMLASAASTYANRYGVRAGNRAVVFTNNDSAYQTALDLKAAAVEVVAVIDARANPASEIAETVRDAGIEVVNGSLVVDTAGRKRLSSVRVMALAEDGGSVTGKSRTLDCDLLALSGGWSPVVHLNAQSGARPEWDEEAAMFRPGKTPQAQFSVGAANGTLDLAGCLREGFDGGKRAAENCDYTATSKAAAAEPVDSEAILPLWNPPSPYPSGRGPKAFIDMQNDVGASDIALAVREGFHSVEHVKRYTAMGFGTDQGKLGNINGMGILAQARGQSIAATGTTTFRPNYTPVSFGAFAGQNLGDTLFDPVRKTAMHGWHEENGAMFEDVGQWKRPWYYPKGGESMQDAVNRECLAARESVGILDASTLGKIEIHGKDSARFLEMIYTNNWMKLEVGKGRYGFMLREDGMVMDDGVTIRLAEDRFFMHTTTGGAAGVLAWMERWLQTEWPEMEVFLTSVTDHWATAAVVGPNSREVVSAVCEQIDFSADAFPFMASKTGVVGDVECRVNRISFSGELAYEVNVPANYGRFMWEKLMQAGKKYKITPYGTETMHVLRAEKGYVIVGQDTDGSVTVDDLGLSWAISKTKGDFIGKRSLSRPDTIRKNRKHLVGLLTPDPQTVIPEGAQLVDDPRAPKPVPMVGHVSSSYYSACCGHSIALALVKGGRDRMGETVHAPLADGRVIEATIADPVFYDKEGARANV